MSHLRTKHGDMYEEDFAARTSTHARDRCVFGFASDKITNISVWMSWVVARNVPLCEAEDPETREMTRLKPISSRTLKIYMVAVTRAVKDKIKAELKDAKIGVMFDSWTCYAEHYIGMFALASVSGVLFQPLLALAPLEEGDQSARSRSSFISNKMGIYGTTVDSVRFLVGDNCSTNQATATKLGVHWLGARPTV